MNIQYQSLTFIILTKTSFFFVAKSPVFTHISATLSGLSTIRAFQAESILQDEFEEHQDVNTGVWFMFIGTTNANSSTKLSINNKILFRCRRIKWVWNVIGHDGIYLCRFRSLLFLGGE